MKKAKPLQLMDRIRNGSEIVKTDEDIDEGSRMWQMKVAGQSEYAIAKELGVPTHRVRKMLDFYRAECLASSMDSAEYEREVDLARLEGLWEEYFPIAKSVKVTVLRTNALGEAYLDQEYKHCIEAGNLCVKVIAERNKILGNHKTGSTEVTINNNMSHSYFRSGESDFINALVAAQPADSVPAEVIDVAFDEVDEPKA